jgi:hypothetical protein
MGSKVSRRGAQRGKMQRAPRCRRRQAQKRGLPQEHRPRSCLLPLDFEIGTVVANVFHVEPAHLRAPNRGPARVVLARQVAIYLAHTGCGLTLREAGRLFLRDRTTAAHGCGIVEDLRDDPSFDRALAMLESVVLVGCGLAEVA